MVALLNVVSSTLSVKNVGDICSMLLTVCFKRQLVFKESNKIRKICIFFICKVSGKNMGIFSLSLLSITKAPLGDTQQQMRRIAKPRVRPRGRPTVERILFSSTPGPGSRVSKSVQSSCLMFAKNVVSKNVVRIFVLYCHNTNIVHFVSFLSGYAKSVC